MKKHICLTAVVLLLAAALIGSLTACDNGSTPPADTTAAGTTAGTPNGDTTGTPSDTGNTPDTTQPSTPTDTGNSSGDTTEPGTTTPEPTAIKLTFSGSKVETSVTDSGVTVEGNAIVITRPGSYELTGELSNGQVRVRVDKTADVELILNNFIATSNDTAPMYIESANKTTLVLATGSVNKLTDTANYKFAIGEDKPNACLYSSDDLTIKGNGSLIVTGKYNNGIGCKNDLRIKSGNITVSAPNNIIKGNDSVEIEEATLTLSGGEDAIKSDNELRTDKGYILITAGAKINITCADDALQAINTVTVEAGATVTGQCGGDAVNCAGASNVDATAMQIKSAS